MRLRETLQILRTNVNGLTPPAQGPQPNQAPQQVLLSELNRTRASLRELGKIKLLNPLVNSAMGEAVINDMRNNIACSPEDWNRLSATLTRIHEKAGLMIALLSEAVSPEGPLTISIKLPPQPDLVTLSQTIATLNKIFDQPARRLLGEGVAFEGFDTGTNWVELKAGLDSVMYLIGRIIGIASDYATGQQKLQHTEDFHREQLSHFEKMNGLEYKLKEQELEQQRILTKSLEDIRDANKTALEFKLYRMSVETAEQVATIPNSKFEGATQIKDAAKEWLALQKKGAEAHLSLMASQLTQELFAGKTLPPVQKTAPAQLPPAQGPAPPTTRPDTDSK